MSNLWNSDQFNPVAAPSDCHSDFMLPIDCSYTQVAGLAPATPQKIADCHALMKSGLLRIISRLEQSGQGEGGRKNEDDEGYNNDVGRLIEHIIVIAAWRRRLRCQQYLHAGFSECMTSSCITLQTIISQWEAFIPVILRGARGQASNPAIFIAAPHLGCWCSRCINSAKHCRQQQQWW